MFIYNYKNIYLSIERENIYIGTNKWLWYVVTPPFCFLSYSLIGWRTNMRNTSIKRLDHVQVHVLKMPSEVILLLLYTLMLSYYRFSNLTVRDGYKLKKKKKTVWKKITSMELDSNYILKNVIETLMIKKQFEFTFHLKKLFKIYFHRKEIQWPLLVLLHKMICSYFFFVYFLYKSDKSWSSTNR